MLKNKIYKYFTYEILKSFFTILFAFTAIAWTVRAVNFLDLIVDNGYSVKTYMLFSFFNIANIITKFIPLSFLLALVLSILKFERQNELLILWTTGLNKIKLINLFFCISLLILFFQLLFSVIITPNILNKSRNLIKVSQYDYAISSLIKANDFTDSFNDLTFFVSSKDENQNMNNIFIRDNKGVLKGIITEKEKSQNTTIIAKTGFLNKNTLILNNGIIQTKDINNKFNNVKFTKTIFTMDNIKSRTIVDPKLQETKTSLLFSCLFMNDTEVKKTKMSNCNKLSRKKNIIENLSRRFGMPIYIPLIALISSFLLIQSKKKKYRIFNRYIFCFISFCILLLAEIMVRYSGFSNIHTFLYFLVPISLMPIIYFILFRSVALEKLNYE